MLKLIIGGLGIFDSLVNIRVSPVQLDIIKVIIKVHQALKPPILDQSPCRPQGQFSTNHRAREGTKI